MRAVKILTIGLLAGSGLVGCNPGDFNSLLDKAPVTSFTPPGPSTGSLFVLPLPVPSEPGTTVAARMLVTRKDTDFFGVADFDKNGKVTVHEASVNDKDNMGHASVYSAAVRADGMMLFGAPRAGGGDTPPGRVSSAFLTSDGVGGYNFNIQPGPQGGGALPRIGISVAAGNVTGIGNGNFVVVGDNNVQVLGANVTTIEAATEPACPSVQLGNTLGDFYAFRPVAVGNLSTVADGLDEIAISGRGKVVILQYNGTGTLLCPGPGQTITESLLATFGTSLAVGDFDGDGNQDLAVGAPPDRVYVFFGPIDLTNAEATPSVLIKSRTPTAFGERIASYHVPGAAAAQLLVGDRTGTAVGGPLGGGKVMLFNISRNVPEQDDSLAAVTLFDANADSSQQELGGTNLGGLLFNTGQCVPGGGIALVPWASTNLDVLTFMNYVGATLDPRCSALAP